MNSNQSYCSKRLSLLNISDQENLFSTNNLYRTFEPVGADDILIRYMNLNGSLMEYKPKGSRLMRGYSRTRIKHPFQDKTGRDTKYLSPKNTPIRPFFNGIVKYFPAGDISTLYLTEGEFKAFMGCKNGIPVVGLSGIHCFGHALKNEEGKTIDVHLLPELKEFIQQRKIKNIVLLHDADATLNEGKPDRLKNFISSVTHFITACRDIPCKLHYTHIKPEFNETAKGLDDLYAYPGTHSEAITKELQELKTGKYFQFYNLQKTGKKGIRNYFHAYLNKITPDYKLCVNEYISEQAMALAIYIATHKRVILKAGTGTGKTTFALKHLAAAWPGRIIILQPLTSNVDSIANDLQYRGNIGVIKAGAKDEDIQIALSSKIVVCTYDSFFKINNYTDQDLIICDEVHKLIKFYGIPDKDKKEQYGRVFKKIATAQNVLLISATPPKLLKKFNFQWVEVQAAKRNAIQAKVIRYKGKITHRLPQVLNNADYSKGRIVVLTNNRDKVRTDLIPQITALKPDEIALVCSDTKLDPGSCYEHIVKTKYIPDHIKLLFVTSLIDCGVDIYSTDIQCAIVAEQNNPIDEDDTIQFLARFRRMEVLQAVIYKKERNVVPIDIEDAYKDLKEYAAKAVDHQNLGLSNTIIKSAYISRRRLCNESNIFTFYNQVTGFFEVKELAVLEHIYKQSSIFTPVDLFCRNISLEPHITISRTNSVEIKPDAELSAIDQQVKEAKKDARKSTIELLKSEEKPLFEAIYHKSKDNTLKREIVDAGYNVGFKISEYAEGLYFVNKNLLEQNASITILFNFLRFKRKGLTPENICRILIEYEGVKLGYLEDELAILHNLDAKHDSLSLQDQQDMKRVEKSRQDLLKAAKKKNRFTADEITAVINQSRPKGIKLSKNKAMRLFGILFTFHEPTRKKVRIYTIEKTRSFSEICTNQGFLELLGGVTQLTSINREISHPVTGHDDEALPHWILTRGEEPPF